MPLFDSPATGVGALIQAAVAPVFLLSAVSVTLGVLTSRLARIVDRARAAEEKLAAGTGDADALRSALAVAARRARLINTAITLATVAALLVALVVVLLFADHFLALNLMVVVASLFVVSMLSLACAFLVFLIEVRFATATLRIGGQR